MHFYDFNIGDYAKKTSHLTNGEDLAYRRALDVYYDTEQPFDLSGGLATLSRRLRVEEKDLKNVIDEFFPDGRNKHADEKIAAYYAFLERQKANGKLGGRPKHKDLKPSANPVVSQNNPVPSQPLPTKPLPTNQINTKPLSEYSDEFEEFWKSYPSKTGKGAAYKSWKKERPVLAEVIKALEWQKVSEQWTKDKGQYIPMPATYLNQRRFEDAPKGTLPVGKFDVNEWLKQK
jgi:uncharacterized protein YdaU (DUF1376 family)